VRETALHVGRFALRVLRDFFHRNNGLLLTGAVAYNALLSLIPLSAVLVVVFSQFFDKELILEALNTEVSLIAPGAAPMLNDVLESFLESRQLAGWLGVIVLLFFGSLAFRVLENAIAIIFHRPTRPIRRRFWVSALLPYVFIGLIALGLMVVTALTAFLDASQARTYELIGIDFTLFRAAGMLLYLIGFFGLVLLFTMLYKMMPTTAISFRLALTGGFTAAILWEMLRHFLVKYFTTAYFVNTIYGSMATTVIVLLTLEAAALIVLLGAQVIADVQRSQSAGTPWYEDPDEPEKDPGLPAAS
jgi:YihY family inner membrane protein